MPHHRDPWLPVPIMNSTFCTADSIWVRFCFWDLRKLSSLSLACIADERSGHETKPGVAYTRYCSCWCWCQWPLGQFSPEQWCGAPPYTRPSVRRLSGVAPPEARPRDGHLGTGYPHHTPDWCCLLWHILKPVVNFFSSLVGCSWICCFRMYFLSAELTLFPWWNMTKTGTIILLPVLYVFQMLWWFSAKLNFDFFLTLLKKTNIFSVCRNMRNARAVVLCCNFLTCISRVHFLIPSWFYLYKNKALSLLLLLRAKKWCSCGTVKIFHL